MSLSNRRNGRFQSHRVARRRGPTLEALEPRRLLNGAAVGPPGSYIAVLKSDVNPDDMAVNVQAILPDVAISHVYSHALKGFAFQGDPARFANDPRIASIEPDIQMHADAMTLPTGVDRIEADQNAVAHIDGNDDRVNVNVAIIDTGIDPNHPDLNVIGGYNATRGSSSRWSDGNGHGTHVAGTVGALDNGPNYQGVDVVGVAPGPDSGRSRCWATMATARCRTSSRALIGSPAPAPTAIRRTTSRWPT